MDINPIFKYLELFKKFPSYQFERRIDSFLMPYLEKAINEKFKLNDKDLVFIYPEYPLQRLDNSEAKHQKLSDAADYLLWSRKLNTVYLVELKTEIKSLKESQFNTYLHNCQLGWKEMIQYYFTKAIGNGQNWNKFINGIIHFENTSNELLGLKNKTDLQKYLIKSRGVHEHLLALKESINFDNSPKVQFLYLAPKRANPLLDAYIAHNKASSDFYIGNLTLEEFAESTEEPLRTLLINLEKEQTELE